MVKFSAITLLLLSSLATGARAGDETQPAARREFKQCKTYPYVFVPVGYLSNGGPLPLLFGPAASDCDSRNPPSAPKTTKKEDTPASAPASTPGARNAPAPENPAVPSPTPTPEATPAPSEMPAYPPPQGPPLPQEESLDLNKYPAEVIDIFKNPYTVPKSRQHFFDPVFEPPQAQAPPQTQTGGEDPPPSKATSREQ